jgi:beta-N-acetylhexosaminidase
MLGALMLDIDGTELTQEDRALLREPQVGGLILFGRNIINPFQVKALTDSIRAIRPELIIAVDQEGGRVQRMREGFTRLPPMRALGRFYDQEPEHALAQARRCGWLMASEVLQVGVDISFAPVLDLDGISQVIGDRGFHAESAKVIALAQSFMHGMKDAGMATTGKHFPGHGSVEADSHIAAPVDHRSLAQIREQDMQVFLTLKPELDALMPAHVIYDQVDANPAGFSPYWIQQIIRGEMGFEGVLFSDDLSMQAACVAGDAGDRIRAALTAGCDMGLVCNDRVGALTALKALETMPLPDQPRLNRMRGQFDRVGPGASLQQSEAWQLARMESKALIERWGMGV